MKKHSENYKHFFTRIHDAHILLSDLLEQTNCYNNADKYTLKEYVFHLSMIDIELQQLLQAYEDPLLLNLFFNEDG